MNITALILEYLKVRQKVTVSGFGDFVLENAAAVLNPEHKTMLPPAQRITYLPDYEAVGSDFENFVARKKSSSLETAAQDINAEVTFWKNKINEGENFIIEGLGTFRISADSVLFEGSRIAGDHSDFYGLEEINLDDLRNRKGNSADPSVKKEYSLGKTAIWLLLLALPVAALGYFGITQPELLFGRKSFTPATLKTMKDTVKVLPVKIDTASSPKLDSVKADSNKINAAVPLAKTNSRTGWKAKKNTTKKWRKPKKQVNHSR